MRTGRAQAASSKAALPFTSGIGDFGRTIVHAVVGGTASALGGGKFSNGAIAGAYSYLFNELSQRVGLGRAIHEKLYDALERRYPGRFAFVRQPGDGPGSSCRAHVGWAERLEWLDSEGLHGFQLGHAPARAADVRRAQRLYVQHVEAGRDERLWEQSLRQQIYLGDERFVERMQALEARRARGSSAPRLARRRGRGVGAAAQCGLSVSWVRRLS